MGFTELFPFMWKGTVTAFLISLSSSVIGVYLLIRRLSMLGAGLAHAAFGSIAVSIVLEIEPYTFTIIYTILLGLGIEYLIQKKGLPADTLIALVYSFGVALAILVLSVWDTLGTNIFSYLFGSILLVSDIEFISVAIVSFLTLVFFAINYNKITALLFNEEIAKLRGISVSLINYSLIALACANIVLSIKAVGLILSTSFISIPPMASLLVANSFFSTIVFSVLFSLVSTLIGVIMASTFDIPPGSAIVISMVFIFLLMLFGKVFRRILKF